MPRAYPTEFRTRAIAVVRAGKPAEQTAVELGIHPVTLLLDRRKWKTRLELANAIFDYTEIFYNRRRHHSTLGYRTPIEYGLLSEKTPSTAAGWPPRPEPERWGRPTCHLIMQQSRGHRRQ